MGKDRKNRENLGCRKKGRGRCQAKDEDGCKQSEKKAGPENIRVLYH